MDAPALREQLYEAAIAARDAGDFGALEQLARDLGAASTAAEDEIGIAWSSYFRGICRMHVNDADGAKSALKTARELFERQGDRFAAARVDSTMAAVAVDIELNVTEGRRLLDQALPVIGESGDLHMFATALANLSELVRLEGDYRRALQYATDAAVLFDELQDASRAGWQHTNIALCHALLRDFNAAFDSMQIACNRLRVHDNSRWIAWWLDTAFIIVALVGKPAEASKILGLADLWRDEVDLTRSEAMLPWYAEAIERVVRALPPGALLSLSEEGKHLSLDDADALIMSTRPKTS